jgi:hypothetical protein
MLRWFGAGLMLLFPALAWGGAAEDQRLLEELLEKRVKARLTYISVFNTHPLDEANNTGNIFNFVPHGHLVMHHSSVGVQLDLGNRDAGEPGEWTAVLSLGVRPSGLVAEAESGEAHHIIAKVVDRNYLEPALRRVFRRRLGEIIVRTLDRTVVDRVSDRLASEILSRVPTTASIREFMVAIGRVLEEDRIMVVRAGIMQPSIGAPRDETGQSRLYRKLITGPDLQYMMSHPGHTLAAETSYLIRLGGERTVRITAGLHQAQDPDSTLGLAFRNAVFDEASTELSLEQVHAPYVQVVFEGSWSEIYASVADSEGLDVAAGAYYQLTGRTAAALEAAFHDRDGDELTFLEKHGETTYREGISATLIRDFSEVFSGYVNAERFEGTVGRRRRFSTSHVETGLVYKLSRHTRAGMSVYRRETDDNPDTGMTFSFRADF